eukprot:1158236-Pelagomonas_calceolata.AAC.5
MKPSSMKHSRIQGAHFCTLFPALDAAMASSARGGLWVRIQRGHQCFQQSQGVQWQAGSSQKPSVAMHDCLPVHVNAYTRVLIMAMVLLSAPKIGGGVDTSMHSLLHAAHVFGSMLIRQGVLI